MPHGFRAGGRQNNVRDIKHETCKDRVSRCLHGSVQLNGLSDEAGSCGARFMHNGVVSSGSPVDIAHVPRMAAQIYSYLKT